MALNESAICH